MVFGRAFEQALWAYFQREDPGTALFREWATHKASKLEYSNVTRWDRMLQQGITARALCPGRPSPRSSASGELADQVRAVTLAGE